MPFGEQLQGFVRTKEMQAILGAIKTSHSRIEAADRLGISARTLRHKLKKLRDDGLEVPQTYAR
jgi:two-component system response regulator FlrC